VARHPQARRQPKKTGLSAEQIPVLVARDRTGATLDGVLPKLDRISVTAVLAGVVTAANQVCYDGGKAIAVFARVGSIPYHVLPKPAAHSQERPICTSTTSTPTTAGSSNGCVASMAWQRKTSPTISAGAELWKQSTTQTRKSSGCAGRWAWKSINN
jgi:hypothetical protein